MSTVFFGFARPAATCTRSIKDRDPSRFEILFFIVYYLAKTTSQHVLTTMLCGYREPTSNRSFAVRHGSWASDDFNRSRRATRAW